MLGNDNKVSFHHVLASGWQYNISDKYAYRDNIDGEYHDISSTFT